MKLTVVERLILANQLKILEKLEPESADFYESRRIAIERGYEGEYRRLLDGFAIDNDLFPESKAKDVKDILRMFEMMQDTFKALKDKGDIDPERVKFWGFDGNNEADYLGFARWWCGEDGGRYKSLEIVNSHMPTMWRYGKMLELFRAMKFSNYHMSVEQLRTLAADMRSAV